MQVKVIPQEVEVIVKSPEKVVVEMTREEALDLKAELRGRVAQLALWTALVRALTP